jgi:peroxiredoxin
MERETHAAPPRRLPRLIVVPLVVLTALAAAVASFRPLGAEPLPSMFVVGSQVSGVGIGQIAPGTERAPSPELALTGLDGAPVSLAGFAGHPVWIVFWRSACEPCEAEAASVAAAYRAHRADGLVVLGIDPWDSLDEARAYTAAHPVEFPVAVDAGGAFEAAYGVWGAPTHYFTDSAGTVVARYFGPITDEIIDLALGKVLACAGDPC